MLIYLEYFSTSIVKHVDIKSTVFIILIIKARARSGGNNPGFQLEKIQK
jgi:hypothetical protein